MKRFAMGVAACLLLSGVTTAHAQELEVSSLETKRSVKIGGRLQGQGIESNQADYIADVSGKRVRLVGPRFYPESNDSVELIGRRDAIQRETVRMEASLAQNGRQ